MVGWAPAYHWADSELEIHAFYCMLGGSLRYLHRRAQAAWPELTLEGRCAELGRVNQRLVQALGIDRLFPDAATTGARQYARSPTRPLATQGIRVTRRFLSVTYAQVYRVSS